MFYPKTEHTTSGIDTIFPYDFPVFNARDLSVELDGVEIEEGFAKEGAGDSAGGRIVFIQPPVKDQQLVISRGTSGNEEDC